jgi:hypothetical protein
MHRQPAEPTKRNISQWMNQNNLAQNGDDGSWTCSVFERYRKLMTQKEGRKQNMEAEKVLFNNLQPKYPASTQKFVLSIFIIHKNTITLQCCMQHNQQHDEVNDGLIIALRKDRNSFFQQRCSQQIDFC